MKRIILIFPQLLIISVLFSVEITDKGIVFLYEDEHAQSVFIVGSMNNWSTTKHPMEKDASGVWRIIIKLDSGNLESHGDNFLGAKKTL